MAHRRELGPSIRYDISPTSFSSLTGQADSCMVCEMMHWRSGAAKQNL
jgi:hypothetical protein